MGGHTLKRNAEGVPDFLSGREFSRQEIQEIQETVRVCRRLSLKELVQTICEHLEWVTPAGRNKLASCAKALQQLEALGLVKLPKLCASKQRKGDKRPFGAHQRYFLVGRGGRRLGCLLFASSAWALRERDAWIGWTERDREQRLNWVVANSRFLIFPWVRVRNLASKALSLAAQRIRKDWEERYGYGPVLLETFVEVARYRGTCYQAANWIRLGETCGRGRMDRHTRYLSTPRAIYVYPLVPEFRAFLQGASGAGQGQR